MEEQPLRIALYQPDIAGNAGACMRLCACLGMGLDIIEPCGFMWDARKMDRAAMDYKGLCQVERHMDWASFQNYYRHPVAERGPCGEMMDPGLRRGGDEKNRIVLLTTKGATDLYDFTFQAGDILLAGRESAGVPDHVHAVADARVRVPMAAAARSLNVVTSLAIVAGEATRQLRC